MSTAQSGSPSPVAAADPSTHWAPHGPVLTACVVGLNLLMVLLVFFYFWRFFSGKRGPPSTSLAGDDEESSSSADTSPAASRRASWRQLCGWPAGQREEDIVSSLPVSVYSASEDAGGQDGKAAECAVCIVEFRDGDLSRLLRRCGHRFHADCVGAWLQLHSTCPLCRASVLAPATTTAAASELAKNNDPKDAAAAAAAVADDECPV